MACPGVLRGDDAQVPTDPPPKRPRFDFMMDIAPVPPPSLPPHEAHAVQVMPRSAMKKYTNAGPVMRLRRGCLQVRFQCESPSESTATEAPGAPARRKPHFTPQQREPTPPPSREQREPTPGEPTPPRPREQPRSGSSAEGGKKGDKPPSTADPVRSDPNHRNDEWQTFMTSSLTEAHAIRTSCSFDSPVVLRLLPGQLMEGRIRGCHGDAVWGEAVVGSKRGWTCFSRGRTLYLEA
eukprot:TRINITY_DN23669_c0_g2_i3.p2 TRINITY_DN23669_c0_g2~~TRINITY_DN23669_c0_g2_i3.p2  ORF type:complete len:237 (+),score=54.33 TRINITY_DN23669_c0_g2_i3:106-816(+)